MATGAGRDGGRSVRKSEIVCYNLCKSGALTTQGLLLNGKTKKIPFTKALEGVITSIWGGTKDHLDDSQIKKTRKALVEIRGIY
ncbi:hypothetical protein ACFLYR_01290 [Chloroflexota bacterium]